ncbi:unnamed protein product [Caenorhabditis brenneri]
MSSIEPQPETLFTQDEINAIEGKMKCFYKLRTHPRILLPELQPFIQKLSRYFLAIREWRSLPFSPETKKVFDSTAQTVRGYEDVIIRVILGGETVEVAMKHQKERQIESSV